MLKPYLRAAVATACLIAAAPALGQSLESRIIDAQTAARRVQNSRDAIRQSERDAEWERIEKAYRDYSLDEVTQLVELAHRVRPRCVHNTGVDELGDAVHSGAEARIGVVICAAYQAEGQVARPAR